MKSFPFDSKILQGKDGDTQYDRAIDSKTLREYFHLLYSNGIFAGDNYECFNVVMDETSVTSLDQTTNDSFRVIVKPGACNIEGALGIEEKETVITIDPVDGDKERVDSIVLRLDTNIDARKISIEYKKGTPAVGVPDKDNPNTVLMPALITTRPKLTRNSTVYELRLADIILPRNETLRYKNEIRDLIQDTRFLTDECGVVLCNPKQIDTNGISNELQEIYKNALKKFEDGLDVNKEFAKNAFLSTADDLTQILKKDEAGKITFELANYVKELKEYVATSDDLQSQIATLQDSSEALQKTTLPAINSNIDKLKKTVDEDIQNTLHSNGTSINSLGDRIGTLVNRVSTLEDKIREGFFFNKSLKILQFSAGTDTGVTAIGVDLKFRENGYIRTVSMLEALEKSWSKSYIHYAPLHNYSPSEVQIGGGAYDRDCEFSLDYKFFRSRTESNTAPRFCLKKGKTKGILLAKFWWNMPKLPEHRLSTAVKFYADGDYFADQFYEKEQRYMWAIPINSRYEYVDLDFKFDFRGADEVDELKDTFITIWESLFDFDLTYIHT